MTIPGPHAVGRRRVALYSHDTQGLGHIRRNIELAAALTGDDPGTEVLLIGSAAGAERLPLPPRTRLALVPAVRKDAEGGYAAVDPRRTLAETLERRGRGVTEHLRDFGPDLVIVDKLARGLGGELDGTLRAVRGLRGAAGLPTRLVLGLRDVLDAPDVAIREWAAADTTETVLSHYDEVWVYGDPEVYDPVREYDLPDSVAERVRYTGYLAWGRGRHLPGRPAATASPDVVPDRPFVLAMVGGGQDGHVLAETFAHAGLPPGHLGVLVLGPQMAPERAARFHAVAAVRRDLVVHDYVSDPARLIRHAAAVVTMGGYNSVCEVLVSPRPALVMPRTTPRLEQAVRAHRLARSTHLDVLEPGSATPARVGAWLNGAVVRSLPTHHVDLDGLARVPALADRLLAPRTLETVDALA